MSAAAQADLRGLVDNATADCLFGWVWNAAAPAERVMVELRLDERVLLAVRADGERPDLAGAGIGDGRHAFALKLPPEARAKRAGLSVVAVAPGAPPMPIPVRLPRSRAEPMRGEAGKPEAAKAEAARAEAARREAAQAHEAARIAEIERRVAELAERLDTMALWLERLDRRGATPDAAPQRRYPDPWQLGVGFLFAVVAAAALGHVAWPLP